MPLSDVISLIPRIEGEDRQQTQRLFHGRGHRWVGLEHVTVDWYPPVLLITLYVEEQPEAVHELAMAMRQQFPECQSIQLQRRYQRLGPFELLWGKALYDLVAAEDEFRFHVSLGRNRNTGLFLDMRNGRRWVRRQAADKRVLNLFAYTCAFSVAAIAGGARAVVNVDMSSPALATGRRNHELNHQKDADVAYHKLDIFKSWGRLKRAGPFDLLVSDPPAFQKGSVAIERDYPKIMRRLDGLMAENSCLLLCLNAIELDREFLLESMRAHAPGYRLSDELGAPDVFVEAEGKGLKILCFER